MESRRVARIRLSPGTAVKDWCTGAVLGLQLELRKRHSVLSGVFGSRWRRASREARAAYRSSFVRSSAAISGVTSMEEPSSVGFARSSNAEKSASFASA